MVGQEQLLSLLTVGLIVIPSLITLLFQGIFYVYGEKYKQNRLVEYPSSIDKTCYSLNKDGPLVSIILPVRKEPLKYIDEALSTIYSWSIRDVVEVIIVSDDEEDDALKIKNLVDMWRQKGLKILYLWRREAKGYRTGALNTGLWVSSGKTVYVMDVDSRVNESFIIKGLNIICREKAFAVVGRWVAKNRDTRLSEAIASAMDYIVDSIYRGRSKLGLPVFPIGTGTIYESSRLKYKYRGWDEERIQDDMELGARIMYENDIVEYLDEEPIYVEVPRRFKSFRIQQERWAYGAMDVAISRFKHVLFSKQKIIARIEAFLFLTQYLPLFFVLTGIPLLLYLTLVQKIDPFMYSWYMSIAWLFTALFYVRNYIRSSIARGSSVKEAIVNLGRISATTIALTPSVSKGMLMAFLRRKYVYRRTPKGSLENTLSTLRFPGELLLAILCISSSLYLIYNKIVLSGLWLLAYSLGYLYTFIRWPKDILYK